MKKLINSALMLGAGGVSMYRLSRAYLEMGIKVYAYDKCVSDNMSVLKSMGAKTTTRFKREFLNVDICICSPAIPKYNKYLVKLKEHFVPIIDRAEALDDLCKYFKKVIAVAGTHGKSTTSALIFHILKSSGAKVSCHIGANVTGERFEPGDDYLVIEACEYNKSFLYLHPDIAVITNVEADHMDTYHNIFELKESFTKFIKKASRRYIYSTRSTEFLTKINNVKSVAVQDRIETILPGEYNQRNIALAKAVCIDLGLSEEVVNEGAKSFKGLPNRDEMIGKYYNAEIYIDYAHHPTEIKCFTDTFLDGNSQIIFQPHTYSRTKYLFDDFVKVFSSIDDLIIYKEYPAREKSGQGTNAYALFKAIKKNNLNVRYAKSKSRLKEMLNKQGKIAFVGAGDISVIAKNLVTN